MGNARERVEGVEGKVGSEKGSWFMGGGCDVVKQHLKRSEPQFNLSVS